MTASTTKNSLIITASIISLILIWKVFSAVIGAEIILPSPEGTALILWDIIRADVFWPAVIVTVFRGLSSFAISCLLGVIVGFSAGFSRTIFCLVQPLITVIRTTPVMSIILLALIWFRTEMVPVFVGFLVSFPIICGNVIEGIRNMDEKLVEMAQIYKVKKWRIFYELYLPALLPYLMAGTSTAMGINWKSVIAAEVLCQPRLAIGTHLQTAKTYLETGGVFAWTLVAIILSFMFEMLLRAIQRRMEIWKS